jgi:hypothetical protein
MARGVYFWVKGRKKRGLVKTKRPLARGPGDILFVWNLFFPGYDKIEWSL